jgi:hypothetical protein
MRNPLDQTRTELISQLSTTARGPRRNGVFALLLVVHTCSILLDPGAIQRRSYRKRLASMKKRLSSLSLPQPLRRAMRSTLEELGSASPRAVPLVLQLLAAPTRESVGSTPAAAITSAAHLTRETLSRTAAVH